MTNLYRSAPLHNNEYADLYLRLSRDREGKTAIERQERNCREWAARNGLNVREIHIDRGRSGFKKGVETRGQASRPRSQPRLPASSGR